MTTRSVTAVDYFIEPQAIEPPHLGTFVLSVEAQVGRPKTQGAVPNEAFSTVEAVSPDVLEIGGGLAEELRTMDDSETDDFQEFKKRHGQL